MLTGNAKPHLFCPGSDPLAQQADFGVVSGQQNQDETVNRESKQRQNHNKTVARVGRLLASVLGLVRVCPAPDVVIGSIAEMFHRIQDGVELPVLTCDADTVMWSKYEYKWGLF